MGTTKDESYLGDGLYATFDGWQIIVRTPRQDGDHWVALEPVTLMALVRFADHVNSKYKVQHFKWQNDRAELLALNEELQEAAETERERCAAIARKYIERTDADIAHSILREIEIA